MGAPYIYDISRLKVNDLYNVFMCGLFNGSVHSSDHRQFSEYVMCKLHELGRTEKLLLRLLINNIYNTNVIVIKVNN